MFFYLFYNSTLIKSNSEGQKNINTLIYGSIIYIVLHAVLFSKNDDQFKNLRTYYWLLFSLDCSSIVFTYMINNNGKLIYDSKINFNTNTLKDIKDLSLEVNKLKTNPMKPALKTNINSSPKIQKNVKFDIEPLKNNLEKKTENKIENKIENNLVFDAKSLGSDASDYDLDEFETSLQN